MELTTATVRTRDWAATDRLGNHVERYGEPVEIGVLVAPGSTNDLDATRPEGVRVDLTLHFPASWRGSLRGARVELGGPWEGEYAVVGIPMPYDERLTPRTLGALNMPVEVQRYDG